MEVTIFSYLDSILYSKKYIEHIKSEESQYNSFMCNRWISMHSNTTAEIINDTTNKYWSELTQPQDHYEFLLNLLPAYNRKKINYIKKVKEEEHNNKNDNINQLSKQLEISQREITLYQSIIDSCKK